MTRKTTRLSRRHPPKYLVIDVDGVMTTGGFWYSEKGKILKRFGPDDNDALKMLNPLLQIDFVSGDKRGFKISKRRIVTDMGFSLHLVSTIGRVQWMRERMDLSRVIYIGDGIFDAFVFEKVGYAIAPANAFFETKRKAQFVTRSSGGNRAVAESCLHILSKFFKPFDPSRISPKMKWEHA